MRFAKQFFVGCKIWRLYFTKLYRLFRLNPGPRWCMLRKPTKSFRLVMRFAVEGVDPQRYWIRKPYMRRTA
jgi:hypothetical protein